jgi:hypothetical protein
MNEGIFFKYLKFIHENIKSFEEISNKLFEIVYQLLVVRKGIHQEAYTMFWEELLSLMPNPKQSPSKSIPFLKLISMCPFIELSNGSNLLIYLTEHFS